MTADQISTVVDRPGTTAYADRAGARTAGPGRP